GEYLLGGATSSSFPCSGQPYWVPVRKLRGPSLEDDEARAAMLSRGIPEFHIDALIGVARAYRDGGAETVTSTVADLTGRGALGFADFVRRNRSFFQ
ncbi:hypothetical protein ACWCRD_34560, partial [Streptomyces sp. NPDC002092]